MAQDCEATTPLPDSWRAALAPVMATPKARRLHDVLKARAAKGIRIYPPEECRLAALALTAPESVQVVILGQDPYHGLGQANGLAFSVPKGVPIPPSLTNIYKEISTDLGLPRPVHGDLTSWAQQGVLLLNSALTVEEATPGSHQNIGWEAITDAVVRAVAVRPLPCAFLLWGSHAQKKASRVLGLATSHHLVLTAPHPSPLSAHRGFLGCRHFSQVNTFLEQTGQSTIDWRL